MVKVALVQAGSRVYDTKATIEKVREFAKRAADAKAELVLFPEAFIGSYPTGIDFGVRQSYKIDEGRAEFERYFAGAIEYEGEESNELASIAAENRLYLVVPVVERDGHTLYCSVFYYGPDGSRIGKHRKLVPTTLERLVWGRGDSSTIDAFSTKIGKIGGAICWENYMPLLRTHLYQNGVQIYLAPTADDSENWLPTMRAIALEGRCYVLSSCQFLTSDDYPADHPQNNGQPKTLIRGGSCAVSPLGKVLVEPVFDKEAFHVVDLDLGEIVRGKFDLDTVGHYSRPDIFRLVVNKSDKEK